MAHILTYYKEVVAQPDTIRALFVKGLVELANIESSHNSDLESLVQYYPRAILFV